MDQYRLSGAWNFRDVGGARTSDGRVVRTGALFRSSELSHLDDTGRTELTGLGIKQIFDLRGDAEIGRTGPDAVPDGVRIRNLPYKNPPGEKAPHEEFLHDAGAAQLKYMTKTYTTFSTLPGASIAIREVIVAIGNGEGPVLVHCAAGKDRAGWTVATVLRAAGVSDEDILADFLLSNGGIEALRAHVRASWPPKSDGTPVDPSDALLGVTEDYYRTGLDAMTRKYSSFEGYMDAIGVTEDDLAKLNRELIVDEP